MREEEGVCFEQTVAAERHGLDGKSSQSIQTDLTELLKLELAKKQAACLEYILVHELAHLNEHRHIETFNAIMDKFLPQWCACSTALNAAPLCH